jgi:hypothetical protein
LIFVLKNSAKNVKIEILFIERIYLIKQQEKRFYMSYFVSINYIFNMQFLNLSRKFLKIFFVSFYLIKIKKLTKIDSNSRRFKDEQFDE